MSWPWHRHRDKVLSEHLVKSPADRVLADPTVEEWRATSVPESFHVQTLLVTVQCSGCGRVKILKETAP